MTVLAGLLILAAILIAAALAVLGTIAAAAEIFPPRFAWGNEAVSAKVSARPCAPRARIEGRARTADQAPRRSVRTGYPRGSE